MKIITLLFFVTGLLFIACNKPDQTVGKKELARYDNTVLTQDQIKIPDFYNADDSIAFVKKKINEWIIRQALAEKAFENISDEDKSIEQQVNEYRTTLYIHAYKQLLLNQQINDNIPTEQINEYYNKFKDELKLSQPIVKAQVIQISISNTNKEQILRLMNSESEKALASLKEICYNNSQHYNLNSEWKTLAELLNETSLNTQIINTINICKGKIYNHIQSETEILVKIVDLKKVGEYPPLEYVSEKIKEILLRKRKEQFLTKLENDLVHNANYQKKVIIQNN